MPFSVTIYSSTVSESHFGEGKVVLLDMCGAVKVVCGSEAFLLNQ